MAERKHDYLETLGRKKRVVVGSFAPNGSSAVSSSSVKGAGITSITWTATGIFKVVLGNYYADKIAIKPDIELGASDIATYGGYAVYAGDYDQATRTFYLFVTNAAGAAADIAAAATRRINFLCVMDDAKSI